MVGVPGRSKRCDTCRDRKVRCDMRRPACGQCLKTRRRCEGYGRELIFVNNTSRETEDGPAAFERKRYSRPNARQTVLASPYSTGSTVPILSPGLGSSACEQHVIGSFWSNYLPNGRPATEKVISYSLYGWTNVVIELYMKIPMIRVGLFASALGLRGLQENNPKMLQKSYQLYGKTLSNLRRVLREPGKHPPHIMLLTLKLVSLYEIWLGSQNRGSFQFKSWCAHVNGKTALALQSNPETFSQGYAHRVFADCRFETAIASTLCCKPSALASPEWKDIPWRNLPKTPRDHLVDIMLDLATITEEDAKLKKHKSVDDQEISRKRLIRKCWSVLQDLQRWEATWGKPASEFVRHRAKLDLLPNRATSSLTPENLVKGHLMLLYWANCIILCDILQSEAKKIAEPMVTIALPEYTKPSLYCRKMASLLEFLLVHKSGFFINNVVLVVFAYSLEYLSKEEEDGSSKDKLRLLQAMRGHVNKGDIKFADSFKSFKGKEPYLKIQI